MSQTTNGEPAHLQGLTPYQKSKVEQLARTRRNQQRCRERKRAHVSELESQVGALQEKIRQCEPCGPKVTLEDESKLDKAIRENAARRDLLLALGFDEATQERFIDSATKRQAVFSLLNGNDEHSSASQTPASWSNAQSTPQAQATGTLNGAISADAKPMQVLNLDANPQTYDFGQNAFDPDNWLFYPGTQDQLQPYLTGLPSDESWLSQPFSNSTVFSNTSTWNNGATYHGGPMTSTAQQQQPESDGCCERCFQDTVVDMPPSENVMVCSTALSMIFRHNRKGLSLAELQKKLRPGMRSPSDDSTECRVDESVLFKVLADIAG